MFIWTISDLFGLVYLAILILIGLVFFISQQWKRWRCGHKRYYETMGCQAKCRDCGKDLGHISEVR